MRVRSRSEEAADRQAEPQWWMMTGNLEHLQNLSLLLSNSNNIPDQMSGCNLFVASHVESLRLEDGSDFYPSLCALQMQYHPEMILCLIRQE